MPRERNAGDMIVSLTHFVHLIDNESVTYTEQRIVSGPVYVELSDAKVAKTKWLVLGKVFADFDADGNLIGVEVVG